MSALRTVWHDILLVWTFFTRIPAPHFTTDRKLSQALWALPLVPLVLVLGQFIAMLLILGVFGWAPPLFFAVLLVAVPVVLTGGLHWDGWADFCDGLGVGRARRAEVIRDSSLGAFGALGLIFLLGFQVWALAEILRLHMVGGPQPIAFTFLPLLFVTGLLSRCAMALAWALVSGTDAHSQVTRLGRPSALLVGILTLFAGALLVLTGLSLVPLLWLFMVLAGLLWFVRVTLGGMNGDGLGAIQVASETLILVTLALARI